MKTSRRKFLGLLAVTPAAVQLAAVAVPHTVQKDSIPKPPVQYGIPIFWGTGNVLPEITQGVVLERPYNPVIVLHPNGNRFLIRKDTGTLVLILSRNGNGREITAAF